MAVMWRNNKKGNKQLGSNFTTGKKKKKKKKESGPTTRLSVSPGQNINTGSSPTAEANLTGRALPFLPICLVFKLIFILYVTSLYL